MFPPGIQLWRTIALTGAVGWLALSTGLAAAETGDDETGAGEGEEVRVAALLDESTTNDMHDDSTILRNVPVLDDDGLTLFGALRVWVGGALQYDYYNIDDIYRSQSNGESSEGAGFRRLEGIFRSQLLDWGEMKLQYDFDDGMFRDVYFRWVSERANTPVTITIGNQKEPIGLDNLSGNKFEMAQERSAPTHAFGRWRSRGVRLHRAFQLGPEQRKFDIFADDTAFITTSIGVFTDDIEHSHDTDMAVTARLTGGREKDGVGMHLGFAGSYREGDFYRISFRPEVSEADRITLALPDANTQGILALEGAYNHGRLHLQGEAYYSHYAGSVDGYGGGGYLQAGWFMTSDARQYNPRWGIQAAHRPSGEYSVELFTRLSVTRGDDDANDWNAYRSLTVGANLHYRRLRGSVNFLYGESQEPIGEQEDGMALVVRAQHLF